MRLISKREGLKRLCTSNSSYHEHTNPESPTYDRDLPLTVPLGAARNSPVAFVEEEIEAYLAKLVERARSPVGEIAACGRKKKAQDLIAARKLRNACGQETASTRANELQTDPAAADGEGDRRQSALGLRGGL